MSVQKFSETIQSKIYKDWLAKLDKNIVNTSAEKLRSQEQTASKTSFYITKDTVQDMYKTITGKTLEASELQLFMQELAKPVTVGKKIASLAGVKISVNGREAVFFESIGFDTISTKLTALLNSYPDVEDAYLKAEEEYYTKAIADLKSSAEYKAMKASDKQKAIDAIERKAKERGSFGYYFNKGHVISIATNLAKQFKQQLAKADVLAENQRQVLLEVLDKYIDKLQREDLATANLPNTVSQELYAGYVKSSDKYLVEIQHRVGNIESGAASIPIVTELRKLFSASAADLVDIVNKSPALGEALLQGEGSPSFKNLIVDNIVNTLLGKPLNKKTYVQKPKLVSKKVNKITKPKSNASKIAKAKALRAKVKAVKPDPKSVQVIPESAELSLTALQNLLDANLAQTIKQNMGDGTRRDILNLRSGRFAESVKVERLSESRAGMITAFYTYMRNPYATFSQGGLQSRPATRDPKLLISKSIREIAQQLVGNRLRSVNI